MLIPAFFYTWIVASLQLLPTAHEFHVSKMELHYKSEQSSLQISLHLFIDDLESALYASYGRDDLDILTGNESEAADSLIALYFDEVFQYTIDGKEITPVYLGKEESDDLLGAWCYMEQQNLDSFDELLINNKLLCDLYNDQKNIVSFKIDNKTKAFHILDTENREIRIKVE